MGSTIQTVRAEQRPTKTKPVAEEPVKAEQAVPAASGGWSTSASSVLKKGAQGPAVTALQQNLVRLGFDVAVDGRFGPMTDSALRAFQADKGLVVSGQVDAQTQRALETGPTAPADAPRRGFISTLVREEVAREHTVKVGKGETTSTTGANGTTIDRGLGVQLALSEQIALKGTKVFNSLVQNDPVRLQYTQQHPDATWAQTKLIIGGGASVTSAIPKGPASLGFSGGVEGAVEVTSVTAHRSTDQGVIARQAQSMVVPFNAKTLLDAKLPPGSEWTLRGTVTEKVNARLGTDNAAEIGLIPSASVGVGFAHQDVYTKSVKVLGDGKVAFVVAKDDSNTRSADVEAKVALQLGALTERPAIKRLLTFASANASIWGQKGKLSKDAAVLDLKTQKGRDHYNKLMKMSPAAATAYIKANDLGPHDDETRQLSGSALNASVFGQNALTTSRQRGTQRAVVTANGKPTTVATEASFDGYYGGFLAKFAMGEERGVRVTSGEVLRGGVKTKAVAMDMTVSDRLNKTNNAQLQRFAALMGTPFTNMPQGNLGKVNYATQLALTNKEVAKLKSVTTEQVMAAYGQALQDMQGTKSAPLWATDPKEFARIRDLFKSGSKNEGDARGQYSAKARGRYLHEDMQSYDAATAIAKQLAANKDKPLDQWGKLLTSLGGHNSTDVRAIMLMLHRLTGAQLTQLQVATRAGQTFTVQPKAAAPARLATTVGALMTE